MPSLSRSALLIVTTLTLASCALQRTVTIREPSATQTVYVHREVLAWNTTHSFYASNAIDIDYALCPGQHLLRRPEVVETSQNIAITLLATPSHCSAPRQKRLTVHLRSPLGHRALTNPRLLP